VRLVLRPDDRVNPRDDLVLRAGGGDVDALTRSAIDNAPDYVHLVAAGHIRSAFTISVNIPRDGIAGPDEILSSPAYARYRPYLRAEARQLLALHFVQIVATTPVESGVEPGPLDLCHFDLVIDAADESELRARVAEVRTLFTKEPNPMHPSTVDSGGDSHA
jgi:hypothetical protein